MRETAETQDWQAPWMGLTASLSEVPDDEKVMMGPCLAQG
jgi:hypothetical protein